MSAPGCVNHDCARCRSFGWTAVADRLPSDNPHRPLLVVYRSSAHGTPRRVRRTVLMAMYSGGKFRFLGPHKETRQSERVTHWRRKPPLPRTERLAI